MENIKDLLVRYQRPTVTYMMHAEFGQAIKQVRSALAANQLSVAVELNATRRINQDLGLQLPPCQILFIESPSLLLQAAAIDASVALFIPLHLVVSGAGKGTLVQFLNLEYLGISDLPVGIRLPVKRLYGQLAKVLENIGERWTADSFGNWNDGVPNAWSAEAERSRP